MSIVETSVLPLIVQVAVSFQPSAWHRTAVEPDSVYPLLQSNVETAPNVVPALVSA